MDLLSLQALIRGGETLTVEFKSDRKGLSDNVIYEEVVAMANAEGGALLIGVEDDGEVTGAQPRHGDAINPAKLEAAIFNNTVPPVSARVSVVEHPAGLVIVIETPQCPEPCATAKGKSLRRTKGADGKPQSSPYYPRDHRSRRIDLGLLDFTAQTIEGARFEHLDPLEFERLRQTVARLRGDQLLLELSPEELAKALRLVETQGDRLVPNVAGLLLLGREAALRELLPTHTVHFQVLDAQQNVKVNDAFHGPLVKILDALKERFDARNTEQEVSVGMIRLPIPDYAEECFREAVGNAVLHRDYSMLQDVYVQWRHDHMTITNPGGFPAGVTLDNLLVHEPTPRNPRLAEAFKRIGLIEQTGRGVDRIYQGQLRYGRPVPDYSRSDSTAVRVSIQGGQASLQFAAFVFEQERSGTALTLNELLALNSLQQERRIDSATAGELLQSGPAQARAVLERLVERGLIEAKGERRGRVYHLSAALYRRLGQAAAYVHAHGIEPIKHEAMIMEFLRAHGPIRRADVMELCGLTGDQAGKLLAKLATAGKVLKRGKSNRGRYYTLPQGQNNHLK